MPTLPTGTVTFLFTDVEGSTRLLRQLGDRFTEVIERHDALLRRAVDDNEGMLVRSEGDAIFAVFERTSQAILAAADAQRAIASEPWPPGAVVRVRMGLHSGEGTLGGGDYVGMDVHRAARVADSGHGGQVILTASTASLVQDSLPDGLALRELGRYRLKDIDGSQELFQLDVAGSPNSFPPLRARRAAAGLPAQRTTFVGREPERAALENLLGNGAVVTLLGAGGTGKTRLALEVAQAAADGFRDGVMFVDLSPVMDPDLVPSTVAAAVGISDHADRPAGELLIEHLADRRMLLVLDNFEQVVDAAPLVQDLCRSTDSVFLVTSRVPLRISGEQRFPLDGLRTDAADSAAVRLFLDRARAVDPGFDPSEEELGEVAEICGRLDGLPLAIEIAASRVAAMSLGMLRDRLAKGLGSLTGGARDLPARQRTLRDAIAWSHDLLDEPERIVFRRLGAFVGGWSPGAVEPVVDPDGSIETDVADAVASLVENNLVRRGEGPEARHHMLETIREFALERLEADADAEAVREAHATYFLDLAETAEPELNGADQGVWRDRLEADHDNFRAVLRWSLSTGRVEVGMRLGTALWRFWQIRGQLIEGREWLGQLLEHPASAEVTPVRGRALLAMGSMAYWQGDVDSVRRFYGESRDVFEELEDESGIAEAYYNLAYLPQMEGDFVGGQKAFADVLRRYEALGDEEGQAAVRMSIGYLGRLRDDPEGSLAELELAFEYFERADRKTAAMDARGMRAGALLAMGRVEEADEEMREIFEHRIEGSSPTGIVQGLWALCQVALAQQRYERALRLDGAASSIAETLGGIIPRVMTGFDDPRETLKGTLDPETIEARWSEGREMSFEEAVEYARGED